MVNDISKYKQIRAAYNDNTVRIYQAYNNIIANEAIDLGYFGSNFKTERMTWIKPSFLWMMYRSGWATKIGQERILAIDICRDGFDFILENAIISSFEKNLGITKEKWKEKIKTSDIRYQWDPERDIFGNPLDYRSIQLGLRRKVVEDYNHNWIKNIEDITQMVVEIHQLVSKQKNITNLLPIENIYPINQKIEANLGIRLC